MTMSTFYDVQLPGIQHKKYGKLCSEVEARTCSGSRQNAAFVQASCERGDHNTRWEQRDCKQCRPTNTQDKWRSISRRQYCLPGETVSSNAPSSEMPAAEQQNSETLGIIPRWPR